MTKDPRKYLKEAEKRLIKMVLWDSVKKVGNN